VVQGAHRPSGDPVTGSILRIPWLVTGSARKTASRSSTGRTSRGASRLPSSSSSSAGIPAEELDDDGSLEAEAEAAVDREQSLTRGDGAAPAARRPSGSRLVNFIRACWAELQRVQWPDRRQVGQATAVVIGFVIIAGAFLGLADYAAQKLVDFIL